MAGGKVVGSVFLGNIKTMEIIDDHEIVDGKLVFVKKVL